MKAKTLVELLTLSANLYMISKDEKFMDAISEIAQTGKEKFGDLREKFETDEESELIQKVISKARQAKEELEKKMEEIAKSVYEKARIAHTDQVLNLESKVNLLKKELALAEARIIQLESSVSK